MRPSATFSVTKSSKAVISTASAAISSAMCRGDDDDAFAVADQHVAREDRRVAAADRLVDVDAPGAGSGWSAPTGGCGRRGCRARRSPALSRKPPSVTTPATPRIFRRATRMRAGRGRAGILAAVEDQHGAGRAFLDRHALRMRRVAEDAERVQVLPRRDVAHRVGLADHASRFGLSGGTPWIIWPRRPRLKSAVQRVAVLTLQLRAGLAGRKGHRQ